MQDVNVNDVVAFIVEVVALVLLGMWAWRAAPEAVWARLLVTIAVVGGAMVLWGLFAAPQATFDVPALALAVKVLVLGGSVLAGFTLLPNAAIVGAYAVVAVLNTALIYVGPFAR
ncbi:hypothetical protein GCM10009624_05370 [Gordonia sinesedis]